MGAFLCVCVRACVYVCVMRLKLSKMSLRSSPTLRSGVQRECVCAYKICRKICNVRSNILIHDL